MSEARVLVTGSDEQLGKAVLTALGPCGVAANPIGDGTIDPSALTGIEAIINCANRVTGTTEAIERMNVAFPTNLAQQARMAGVRRFVQVSSFSVYGRAEQIDAATPLLPLGDYGRSKLAAEQALLALDHADFRVSVLRLPFMFSAQEPEMLGRLVALMLRLRVLPSSAAKPCRRSMITYASAAATLIELAKWPDPSVEVCVAADPRPLDLTVVARLIDERLGRRIAILPIPEAAVLLVGRIAPAIADRLFRSSVLSPSANLLEGAGEHGVEAALMGYLDGLVAGRFTGQHRRSC